jgi:hypothetical protein
MATSTPKPGLPTGTPQLHVELREIAPKIWRRVLVPETIALQRLHAVIQAAFQWGGGHLHEFEAAGERYGSSDPDNDSSGSVLSERTRLTKAMTRAGTIDYVYDFGITGNTGSRSRRRCRRAQSRSCRCVSPAPTRRLPMIAAVRRATWTSCRRWPTPSTPNMRT